MRQFLFLLLILQISYCKPAEEKPKVELSLASTAFTDGQNIPAKYTCEGDDISLPLAWSNTPEGTKSFALVVDDPDAKPVAGKVWDHWLVYNIPAAVTSLAENIEKAESVEGQSFTQSSNSKGDLGYQGPCPPEGSGVHHYNFYLYALKSDEKLEPNLSKQELLEKIKPNIISESKLTGLYEANKEK
ncbi:MAG: YbhB/YbcL family Raf kinase inhibitor-like protein [Spirochaetota bacterium]